MVSILTTLAPFWFLARWLVGYQLLIALALTVSSSLRECRRPNPWYMGKTPFHPWRHLWFIDAIVLVPIYGLIAALISDHFPSDSLMPVWVATTVIGSYVLLSWAGMANQHTLPMRPPLPKPDGPTSPGPGSQARQLAAARGSSEGLSEIFSRRDPALNRIGEE
jgi:hypothetical protein